MCLTKERELLQPTVPSIKKNARQTVPLYRKKNALCIVPDLCRQFGHHQPELLLQVATCWTHQLSALHAAGYIVWD